MNLAECLVIQRDPSSGQLPVMTQRHRQQMVRVVHLNALASTSIGYVGLYMPSTVVKGEVSVQQSSKFD